MWHLSKIRPSTLGKPSNAFGTLGNLGVFFVDSTESMVFAVCLAWDIFLKMRILLVFFCFILKLVVEMVDGYGTIHICQRNNVFQTFTKTRRIDGKKRRRVK